MREIKFRAKRVDNGEWVYGDLLSRSGKAYIFLDLESKSFHHSRKLEVDPKTVRQYTGLKDKNGKEIYEDDIVDVVMNEEVCNPSTKYLIEYHNTGFYLKGENIDGDIGYVAICGYDCCIKSIEVVGNKYENPELLDENNG